jgi:hypothetical protein
VRIKTFTFLSAIAFSSFLLFFPNEVTAHCDSVSGPVVSAAKKAINENNVNYALIWVKPESEEKIKKALKKAKKLMKNSKDKDEMDKIQKSFFETVVWVHREGEGASYEGIRSDDKVEPEILLADEAIDKSNLDKVLKQIKNKHSKHIILHLFHKILETKDYEVDNLVSGREYVNNYVQFIHAVEKALKGEDLNEVHTHLH